VCGTILHACVLVWGCAGDGRVLAVPAPGAGDMDNYSVSLSAGPSMQVLTTAPSQCIANGRTRTVLSWRAVCTL
jgi:hypothetical protein